MLLVDKSNIKEKLSGNKPIISLNQNEKNESDISDLYTTENIISHKHTLSKIEYNGLPSKSSFINIELNTSGNYHYELIDKNTPNNNFNCKPIIYAVNNKREIPFLLYLLKYNQNDNEYGFIDIPMHKFSYLDDISILISKVLKLEIKYSGFVTYEKCNFLFFECLNKIETVEEEDIKEVNKYKWSLISEIMNNEMIYNIKINSLIKKLLINNSTLLNIRNKDNKQIYEVPSICYYLVYNKNKNESIWYTDYDNILKLIENIKQSEREHYYISRGALFSGLIKCNIETNNVNSYCKEYNSIYNLYMPDVNNISLVIEIRNNSSYIELSLLKI